MSSSLTPGYPPTMRFTRHNPFRQKRRVDLDSQNIHYHSQELSIFPARAVNWRSQGLQMIKICVTSEVITGKAQPAGLPPAGRSNGRWKCRFFIFFCHKEGSGPRIMRSTGNIRQKNLPAWRKKFSSARDLTVQTTNSMVWTHCNDNCGPLAAFRTSIIFVWTPMI